MITLTGRRATIACAGSTLSPRFHAPAPSDPATGPALTATLHVSADTDAPAALSALGLERNLLSGGISLVQRVALLPGLPCAIMEWQATGNASATLVCELGVDATSGPVTDRQLATPRGDAPAWSGGQGFLRIGGGAGALCLLSHADTRFVPRRAHDGVRCTIDVPLRGPPARLVLACTTAEDDDLTSILDAARNADGLLRARAATLRRRSRECLTLHGADPSARRILQSAVLRLDAVPGGDSNTLADLAVSAMAAGDFELAAEFSGRLDPARPSVRRLVRLLHDWSGDARFERPPQPDPGPGAGSGTGPDAAPSALLASDVARRIVALDPSLPGSVTAPILGLIQDVLGVEPDATRGRIRMRPVVPGGWTDFEVRNLAMGDSRIRVRLERSGQRLAIEIEQTRGAVPVRAILEPVLEARALVRAQVDGTPARLAARPLGNRIQVPVQLVLDHARHVVLEAV